MEKIAEQEQKQFSFETLLSATKDFHPTHKLGEGGFGPVYKVNISLLLGVLVNPNFCLVKRIGRVIMLFLVFPFKS